MSLRVVMVGAYGQAMLKECSTERKSHASHCVDPRTRYVKFIILYLRAHEGCLTIATVRFGSVRVRSLVLLATPTRLLNEYGLSLRRTTIAERS